MFGSAMYGHNYQDNYFGAAIHYLDYGQMQYADEFGNLLGTTFTAKDICLNLMYARQLGPMFRVGATIKPIFSVYEAYTSFAFMSLPVIPTLRLTTRGVIDTNTQQYI